MLLLKKILPVLVPLFLALNGLGQNPDIKRTYNWFFGNKIGLDFSDGTPSIITNSSMTAEEGSASISDTCGNLLFYTDGDTIWNRNNIAMPNGTGLMGCGSSTQSALIVPQPGSDSLYYIFVTDCGESPAQNGTRYSVVDMSLDGGMGDVIEKNTLIHAPSMEKLAGTYHGNGTDVWILSVNKYPPGPPPDTSYQYYAYLLSSSGISGSPVISPSIKKPHNNGSGYMRLSHSGSKFANIWPGSIDTIEYADFDNLTGIVTNSIAIADSSQIGGYGLEFSADDSKLYCSAYYTDSCIVVQYDVSSNDSALISTTRTVLKSRDWINYASGALQLGSGDGKIYVMLGEVGNYIDVIQNANVAGIACNYSTDALNLGTALTGIGLPNFISSYLLDNWQQPCNSGIDEYTLENNVLVYPNPSSGIFTVQGIKSIQKIEIYNPLGELIFSQETNGTELTVNLKNAEKGVYLIRLQHDNTITNHKIIIY